MSEKRFVPSKYAGHTYDVKTDKHYYVTDEYVGCRELFDEIEMLENENEQLRKENENLKQQVILAQKGRNVYMKALLEEDDNDDSFIGNWTDKPVLLERRKVEINGSRRDR